jgi:hypothetical protein
MEAWALLETEHDRPGPEQELFIFLTARCPLLPYYYYLPAACVCVFSHLGHNWGFVLFITPPS